MMSIKNLPADEVARLVEVNKTIYNEFFDPDFTISLLRSVLEVLDDGYFRSRFIGFEELPRRNNPDRPLIYAGNHSGMAFPWDAMIFGAGLMRLANFELKNSVRPLTAPMLSESNLMNPFMLPDFWKRAGGIDARMLNFETMMHYKDSNILVYPEGVPGIGKGFNKRYRLQRFYTSFVRMSLKYRTDIIPVLTVNGEYINPYSYNLNFLNKIVNKVGIPFLPVGFMTLLIPLQPWLFYFGFPAKLTFVRGKRIKPYQMLDKPYEEITQEEVVELTGKIREQMQAELNEAVARYGRKPFEIKEYWVNSLRNWRKFPFFLPAAWPVLFSEYDRRYRKYGILPEKFKLNLFSFFKMVLRNPFTIFFFIPILGWIPLLIRGLKRRA